MKTDCFGYEPTNSGCRILKLRLCENGGRCPFFKTHAQLEEENLRTAKRLQGLKSVYCPDVEE